MSSAADDGRARRWDSHRAARRAELTRAARRAIHYGGPELSMDEIAAAIGTSKSIVYRYFNDRAGLQRAVGEAVLEDLGAALAEASHQAGDPHAALRAMVDVYLRMVTASPSVYLFVTRSEDRPTGDDGTAPMRVLAHDAAALLVPALTSVLTASGREPELARIWAAGVIGFVRGAADIHLADFANDDDAAGDADTDEAGPAHTTLQPLTAADRASEELAALERESDELAALADAIADFLNHGTNLPAAEGPTGVPERNRARRSE